MEKFQLRSIGLPAYPVPASPERSPGRGTDTPAGTSLSSTLGRAVRSEILPQIMSCTDPVQGERAADKGPQATHRPYRFDRVELRAAERELWIDGAMVALGGRAFDLLHALIERRDRVVTKDELLDIVWRGLVVEEHNLYVQVSTLRKLLGPKCIITIPGRGYRFAPPVAPVREPVEAAPTQGRAAGIEAIAAKVQARSAVDRPSLAVLPFINLTGDPEEAYFADGLVEEITTAVARTGQFLVIARNSSFVYKGRAVDVRRVGRELGVRYVLEGSVRRSAGRIRIGGQLIEAETGGHLWADHFDGALDDVFDLQDRITDKVVWAIIPSVHRAEIERLAVELAS